MDLSELYFLFYRIMPFVLISFFTLYSVIQGTGGGIIVVVGVLISSIIPILISNNENIKNMINAHQDLKKGTTNIDIYRAAKCNILSFNNQILSYLPLSTHTISFLAGYLINIASDNVLLFAIMVVFLIIDVAYNFISCSGFLVLIPVITGGLCGWGWGAVLGQELKTVPGDKCSQLTTRKAFNCRKRGI